MSGDYSRVRFDPKNDFSGVLMQQGRVQLDADWNELVALLDRRCAPRRRISSAEARFREKPRMAFAFKSPPAR